MSENWRSIYFDKYSCKGVVLNKGSGNITIKGKVDTTSSNPTILYWASSPPNFNTSYSGSGLPYANPEQAYDRSPNVGAVKAENGEFEFNIFYPNSYYVGLGSLYIPPHVHLKVCDGKNEKYHSIKISEGIPFRTLTYPAPPSKKPRKCPLFYHNPRLTVRSQEQILRDSGYPSENKMPDDFWGKRPPV